MWILRFVSLTLLLGFLLKQEPVSSQYAWSRQYNHYAYPIRKGGRPCPHNPLVPMRYNTIQYAQQPTRGNPEQHTKQPTSNDTIVRPLLTLEIYSLLIDTPAIMEKFFGPLYQELQKVNVHMKLSPENKYLINTILERLAAIKNSLIL